MKRGIYWILLLAVLCLAGYWVSVQINHYLGIQTKPKKCVELNSYEPGPDSLGKNKPYDIRIFSLAGVGVTPDTTAWGGDYSHTSNRFSEVFSATPPYVNQAGFEAVKKDLNTYIDQMKAFDYNGILLGGFLGFVSFDHVGNGQEVYTASDSIYTQQQAASRKYYGELMDIATLKGLDVYISTDMVALSEPLKEYLLRRFGSFDTENREFWNVYQAGLEELFEKLPQVDGIMIRIGEAGTIYNRDGAWYTSELLVKSEQSVQLMIQALLETAEKYDKKLIFRSWSVGVGSIGDMHTNVETYHQVFNAFDSDHLIISTKYCSGDFYAWLPFNPTLLEGDHQRIIEFQCRREFEGMNAFPNYMAPLYASAIRYFAQHNAHLSGIWVWPQSGGPQRAGPLSIYPFHGFNLITDLNVFALGKLINEPNRSVRSVTQEWVSQQFGRDSILVEQLTDLFMNSHELTRIGLYISEYAKNDVRALGLEPPPMMWIFEWDLVGGSSSTFSIIYELSKHDLEAVIQEGYTAADLVRQNKETLENLVVRVSGDISNYELLIESVDYQYSLFTTLADYRNFFLHYFQWLEKGGKQNKKAWQQALTSFQEAVSTHYDIYGQSLDFPSYDFSEAENLAKVASRSQASKYTIMLSVLLVIILLIRTMIIRNRKASLQNLVLISFLLIGPGLLAFTSFSGWYFWLFLLILTITYLAGSCLMLRLSGIRISLAETSMVLIPGLFIILLILSLSIPHGPMQFWSQFWTSAFFRTLFFTLFVTLILAAYIALVLHARQFGQFLKIKILAYLLIIQGVQFIIGAGITFWVGFENILTLFNNELLILPGGLSKIMGITTHLDIPLGIPGWIFKTGIGLFFAGFVLWIPGKKTKTSTISLDTGKS